jgi:hypothetical protein
VDLARVVGDPVLLGELLTAFELAGDSVKRKAIYEDALAITRRSGDRINTGLSHNNLADSGLGAGSSPAPWAAVGSLDSSRDDVGAAWRDDALGLRSVQAARTLRSDSPV